MPSPLYTFFPFTADGASLLFEALVFGSDTDAINHATWLLGDEPSAVQVVICDGEREVSRAFRSLPALGRVATCAYREPHA